MHITLNINITANGTREPLLLSFSPNILPSFNIFKERASNFLGK